MPTQPAPTAKAPAAPAPAPRQAPPAPEPAPRALALVREVFTDADGRAWALGERIESQATLDKIVAEGRAPFVIVLHPPVADPQESPAPTEPQGA